MSTKEKILEKALEMFNERGIEYVGLRELAAELDIRVSNITYYFPTKDDLVFELSTRMSAKNSEIIIHNENLTITVFLETLRQVFENHYHFRCLLRSFVHIMTQNKLVWSSYKKIQAERQATVSSNIKTLVSNGYLKTNDEELNLLVTTLSLISRYWISEAAVFSQQTGKTQLIKQNLLNITNLLLPYTSAKAKKEITAFRESL